MAGTGGKAIGLEGTWGSGKSTVVEIATGKLSKRDASSSEKHIVFLFDAWAHQGDPILRVFLDDLIVTLSKCSAIDKEAWKEKLDKLRSRTKRTKETRAEQLTWPAKVMLLTLPLWPLAGALISKDMAWLALLLVAVPYLALVCAWLRWNHLRTEEGKWFVPRTGKEGRSVLWAFTKQTDESVVEQLIREEEATTIEFNRIFDELIQDAKKHNSKVVIVLDNLDRLPAKLIREVWAVMRNFFASSPRSERQSVLENVSLVVPFDRAHIEAVFDEDKGSTRDQNGNSTPKKSDTPGFIEKTFEIVLRVSPPLLSNWREYLQQHLDASLGDLVSKQQAYNIFKLFELDKTAHDENVTPREIISYLNSILGQHHQWGSTIPLECQALYVLNRAALANDIKPLQTATLLDPRTKAYVEEWDWTRYLAAAHFNVDPNEALEVLLSPKIEGSLAKGSAADLGQLQATQGFELLLHSTVLERAEEWARHEPGVFLNVAAAIGGIELNDQTIQMEIWDRLSAVTGHLSSLSGSDALHKQGLTSLISKAAPRQKRYVATNLLKAISLQVANPVADTPNNIAYGEAHFSLVEEIASALKPFVNEDSYNAVIRDIPSGTMPHQLLGVASAAARSQSLSFDVFKIDLPAAELGEALATAINEPQLPGWLLDSIKGLARQPSKVQFVPARDAARTRLQSNNYGNLGNARLLIEALKAMPVAVKSWSIFAALANDGALHALAERAREASEDELAAILLHQIIKRRDGDLSMGDSSVYGSLEPYRVFANSLQKTPQQYSDIVDYLSTYFSTSPEVIVSFLTEDTKSNELYREIFRGIVRKETYSDLPIDVLVDKFYRFETILGNDLAQTLARKMSAFTLGDYLAGDAWGQIDPSYVEVAVTLRTEHAGQLLEGLKNYFNSQSAERWSQILLDEENALDLLMVIRALNQSIDLDTTLFDALQAHAESLLGGSHEPSAERYSKWSELPELLSDTWKRRFFVWLRDRLVQRSLNADTMLKLLKLYGVKFVQFGDLSGRASVIVADVIDPLLASGSDESLQWIQDHGERLREVVKKAGSDGRIVGDRLESLFAEASEDARKIRIEELAIALGVEGSLGETQGKQPNEDGEQR